LAVGYKGFKNPILDVVRIPGPLSDTVISTMGNSATLEFMEAFYGQGIPDTSHRINSI
jgi:hypothetical protein